MSPMRSHRGKELHISLKQLEVLSKAAISRLLLYSRLAPLPPKRPDSARRVR